MGDGRDRKIKLLAVASAGGHWEELMLLRPALEPFVIDYATTNSELAIRDGLTHVHLLPDSNRNRPFRALLCLWRVWNLIRRTKPDFVVTTGALPGLISIIAGRSLGAKAIWIDSIANSEKASMSGWCARWFATLWLTQWEHLAQRSGRYEGALL